MIPLKERDKSPSAVRLLIRHLVTGLSIIMFPLSLLFCYGIGSTLFFGFYRSMLNV